MKFDGIKFMLYFFYTLYKQDTICPVILLYFYTESNTGGAVVA